MLTATDEKSQKDNITHHYIAEYHHLLMIFVVFDLSPLTLCVNCSFLHSYLLFYYQILVRCYSGVTENLKGVENWVNWQHLECFCPYFTEMVGCFIDWGTFWCSDLTTLSLCLCRSVSICTSSPSFSLTSTSHKRIEILVIRQRFRQLLAVVSLCMCRNGCLWACIRNPDITSSATPVS